METGVCWFCEKPFQYKPHSQTGKFCNNQCQQDYQRAEYIYNWEVGNVDGANVGKCGEISNYIRSHFRHDIGRCEICGNDEWMGETIPIDVDHIDGDASNHCPDNVRPICPNCHAQTSTYKGKNKGNGTRDYRSTK